MAADGASAETQSTIQGLASILARNPEHAGAIGRAVDIVMADQHDEDLVGALEPIVKDRAILGDIMGKVMGWAHGYRAITSAVHKNLFAMLWAEAHKGEQAPNRTISVGTGLTIPAGATGTSLTQVGGTQSGQVFQFASGMVLHSITACQRDVEQTSFLWIIVNGSFTIGDDLVSPVASDMNLALFDTRSVRETFRADFYQTIAVTPAIPNNRIPIPMSIVVRHTDNAAQQFGGLVVQVYDPRTCTSVEMSTSSEMFRLAQKMEYDLEQIGHAVQSIADHVMQELAPSRPLLLPKGAFSFPRPETFTQKASTMSGLEQAVARRTGSPTTAGKVDQVLANMLMAGGGKGAGVLELLRARGQI